MQYPEPLTSEPSQPVESTGPKGSRQAADPQADLAAEAVIDRHSPVPYYFQLSTYVEGKVRSKEWQTGLALPSEQEFCDILGVSRTVVRQALAELDRRGVIAKHNGKRSTIAYPKYEGELMQDLRGFYEDALAMGRKTTTKVLEARIVPASKEVAEALRIPEGEPVIKLNRLRYLDGDPEVVVVTYLPEKRCPLLLEEDFSTHSLYETLSRKYNHTIGKGIRSIEAIGLNRTDARLLTVRVGSPALLLKSIGLLADDSPIEYFIAKHRGDRSRFLVRLVRS